MHRSKSGTCAVTNHQKTCNFIFISNEINEDGNFLSRSFSSNTNHTDYGSGDDDDDDNKQQLQQYRNKCAVANNKQCVLSSCRLKIYS
jgi:hypothetical protein